MIWSCGSDLRLRCERAQGRAESEGQARTAEQTPVLSVRLVVAPDHIVAFLFMHVVALQKNKQAGGGLNYLDPDPRFSSFYLSQLPDREESISRKESPPPALYDGS